MIGKVQVIMSVECIKMYCPSNTGLSKVKVGLLSWSAWNIQRSQYLEVGDSPNLLEIYIPALLLVPLHFQSN